MFDALKVGISPCKSVEDAEQVSRKLRWRVKVRDSKDTSLCGESRRSLRRPRFEGSFHSIYRGGGTQLSKTAWVSIETWLVAKGGRGGIYRRRRGQLVAATVGFGYWSLECVQCVFYPKSKHSNDNSVQKASNNHRRYTLRYTKSFEPVPT